jgi:hypothetical protein
LGKGWGAGVGAALGAEVASLSMTGFSEAADEEDPTAKEEPDEDS